MPRKLNHAVIAAWLLRISVSQLVTPALAAPPMVEEVLGVLGMNKDQVAELAQGQPITYSLTEGSVEEIAAGIAWYLPVPLAKVTKHLWQENPNPLDVDVTAYGMLTENSGAASFTPAVLPREEAEALFDVEPGDKFNLSTPEIDSFKNLKKTLKPTPHNAIQDRVSQHYQEMLYQRYKAYRHGGTKAIAPYAREDSRDVKPSLELQQAAKASVILTRYLPALYQSWLNYPKPLPPGANEAFPWVKKKVESRPAVILRHRINMAWNDGALVLTREFYTPHSYNSSQWITGCLAYRDGTVIFQQVRSYTDQVAGIASDVKHIFGRQLLKDKMLKSFERLCGVLGQCH